MVLERIEKTYYCLFNPCPKGFGPARITLNQLESIEVRGIFKWKTIWRTQIRAIPYLFVNVFETDFQTLKAKNASKCLDIPVTVPGWINDDIWRGSCINHRSQFPTKLLNGRNDLHCVRRHFLPSDHLYIFFLRRVLIRKTTDLNSLKICKVPWPRLEARQGRLQWLQRQ